MSIPSRFRGLVDDAAIFPPGLAPLPEAVVAHAGHVDAEHRALVGPFVVDTARLVELIGLAAPALFPSGMRVMQRPRALGGPRPPRPPHH